MRGFCSLASGSKGNALYLGTAQTKILIDAGLSAKLTIEKLKEIGVELAQIEAILVTHEHGDHIRGIGTIASKYNIPVFANSDSAKAICSLLNFKPRFKIFSTGETFQHKDLEIHPFSVQHDTLDPVAFVMRIGTLKLGICTDLGFATSLVQANLKSCDYLYLEANHDPKLVLGSNRNAVYKKRVLSRQGHLSNKDCADLLSAVAHTGLKKVYLAHLSSECNRPDLALQTVREVQQFDIPLSIATQGSVSEVLHF